jgi:hypothetical protein
MPGDWQTFPVELFTRCVKTPCSRTRNAAGGPGEWQATPAMSQAKFSIAPLELSTTLP